MRHRAQEFASRVLRPAMVQRDRDGVFVSELYRQCGREGFPGLPFPARYGGGGQSWLAFLLAVEAFARVDAAFSIAFSVTADLSALLHALGTEEQKKQFLEPLVRGTHVAAFGLTEIQAGSDARGIQTRARREGGFWVLNGHKAYITNSGTDITLFAAVFCVTGERPEGQSSYSCLLVPNGTPGFLVQPRENKLGLRSADMHRLLFEECRVPEANLLGREGEGLHAALGTLDFGRVILAAAALGLAQACFDEMLRYAQERTAFGSPLGAQQSIQFELAQFEAELALTRLAVYQAARCFAEGTLTRSECAIAKLQASELCQRIAVAAVDLLGAAGFMNDSDVARFYRDAKAMPIVEGTSHIQKLIIARELGLH